MSLISHRHYNAPKNKFQFVQSDDEPIPFWAVNVQPYRQEQEMKKIEENSFVLHFSS